MPDIHDALAQLSEPPRPGKVIEVAEGILWARLALPFALDHVNVFFIEDDGGFAVVDTGIGDEPTRQAWTALLDGPLQGQRITRLILTHHHPDHMGMAGWLVERTGAPIHMTDAEFLLSQHLAHNARAVDVEGYEDFYRRHGMELAFAHVIIGQGHRYKRTITGMPWRYRPLEDGAHIGIGGRDFEVLTGRGHSVSQAMLLDASGRIFLAADQILPGITPNIAVSAISPEADPLGGYLQSLIRLRRTVDDDVLTLPGHRMPFTGLHKRIDELSAHHEQRCRTIEAACRERPLTAAEVRPLLFNRALDPHALSFAFGETLAHMNMMAQAGRLAWEIDGDVHRAVAA